MTTLRRATTKFPGTLFLLATCILLQVLGDACPNVTIALALVPARGLLLTLLNLITHQFVHGGWGHLLGNFEFGLPFLLYLEHKQGRDRFLKMYLLCGLCAAITELLLGGIPMQYASMLGSSGSIFGCAVAACLEFGETRTDHVLALLLAATMLLPQIAMGPYGILTGVAYFAHVGGALGAMFMSKKLFSTSDRC